MVHMEPFRAGLLGSSGAEASASFRPRGQCSRVPARSTRNSGKLIAVQRQKAHSRTQNRQRRGSSNRTENERLPGRPRQMPDRPQGPQVAHPGGARQGTPMTGRHRSPRQVSSLQGIYEFHEPIVCVDVTPKAFPLINRSMCPDLIGIGKP